MTRSFLRHALAGACTPLRPTGFAAAAAATLLCAAHAAHAQSTPDAGTLLRESRQQAPVLPTLPPPQAPRLLRDTGVKVTVQRFEISGNTRIPSADLQAALAGLAGQQLGFAQLQAAADRLAALYRERGLHASVLLPEQTLDAGVVRILVVEGRLGRLRVESDVPAGRTLPLARIERMLARGQTPGDAIDVDALEQATLVANELPGVRVSALLAAGAQPGETDIVVKVDARPLFFGTGTLDNQDARATGELRLGASANLGSAFGIGDDLALHGDATRGKQYLRAGFGVPLNDLGSRAAVNASAMRYELVGDFAASGAEGRASTAGAVFSHPLLRSAKRNVYASASVDYKRLKNDSPAGNLSDKTVRTLLVGFNGDSLDTLGGGGASVAGLQLTGGRLNLERNAADLAADAASYGRQGGFTKFNANVGRLQRLHANGNLWLAATGQYARQPLDSGEKFTLGGANGVRAYPAIEGSGDHGWIASAEYRHTFGDAWTLTAFYDHGQVTREREPLPSAAQPNRYALKGAGLATEVQLPWRLALRASIASRIGDNPAAGPNGRDGDGSKRRPRAWFLLSVPFSQ